MSRALLLAGLLLAAIPGAAQQVMHYSYTVTGDAQARPIQAFDDGARLYVQLRHPDTPPAPIGPSGPLAYTLRGPYLVLPLVPSVTLVYGPYSARVLATGNGDVEPGVVSVTRPVEVHDRPPVPAPAWRPPSVPSAVRQPAPVGVVSGEIVATGAAGTRASGAATEGAQVVTFGAGAQSGTFAGWRGKQVTIRADGTTAGATAALASRTACRTSGAEACAIDYQGAPAGRLLIVETH